MEQHDKSRRKFLYDLSLAGLSVPLIPQVLNVLMIKIKS
jgi:hypothetical protein